MAKQTTYLSDEDLAKFRRMLLDRRNLIVGSYRGLVEDVQETSEPEQTTAQSNMPTHPADLATETELDERALQLAEHERNLLIEIDEAIRRIDDKTYGVCLGTGKPIPKKRLQTEPWAKYTIEYEKQA